MIEVASLAGNLNAQCKRALTSVSRCRPSAQRTTCGRFAASARSPFHEPGVNGRLHRHCDCRVAAAMTNTARQSWPRARDFPGRAPPWISCAHPHPNSAKGAPNGQSRLNLEAGCEAAAWNIHADRAVARVWLGPCLRACWHTGPGRPARSVSAKPRPRRLGTRPRRG